jgi:two-component system phosphate regulon sensor histidine kinase PhoR
MANVKRDKLRLSAFLMILAIIGIAAFQGYWIRKLYSEGWADLKKETDIAFRDVVYKLQMQHFRNDSLFLKHDLPPNLFLFNLLDSMRSKFIDSGTGSVFPPGQNMTISIETHFNHDSSGRDSLLRRFTSIQGPILSTDSLTPRMLRYYSSGGAPESPLSVGQIDSAYKKELLKSHITVPFSIQRIQGTAGELDRPVASDRLETNFLFVGLSKTFAYQASFGSPVSYILNRMKWPISMGFLLLAFTSASFIFLYRNFRQQQRLADLKNEFISNMTHELKTPISTIKVAVEALRHFDALEDPLRTREYLDISTLELQRLSMLVDKVLKLSQFENKEIEFTLMVFDLRELAAEVIAGMKLQFEKAGALAQLTSSGEGFEVKADRAHVSSVISNLLDNALKYSKESPVITVHVVREEGKIVLAVTDNGIGIPAVYIGRLFDKFFRVPSNDHHNIKGYGLGLNYVQHIIGWHKGSIGVESKEGKGSTFTIKLPAV